MTRELNDDIIDFLEVEFGEVSDRANEKFGQSADAELLITCASLAIVLAQESKSSKEHFMHFIDVFWKTLHLQNIEDKAAELEIFEPLNKKNLNNKLN